MKNFYPDGRVMPKRKGSVEPARSGQAASKDGTMIGRRSMPSPKSVTRFNSYRKQGKAGSPPVSTSNLYDVLKRVDWLVLFSPWYLINKAKRYSILLLPTIFVSVFICFSGAAKAQSRPEVGAAEAVKALVVGQKVPDEFWTKEHLFYINGDTVRKTLEEHRGKMLVLDFWMTSCTRCLLHQKEINVFKSAYPDDLAVVMVNSIQTREDYHKIFNYSKTDHFKKLGLEELVSIIEDDYLVRLFEHYAYPTYVWINPRGNVQLQTFRNLLDRDYQVPYINKKR